VVDFQQSSTDFEKRKVNNFVRKSAALLSDKSYSNGSVIIIFHYINESESNQSWTTPDYSAGKVATSYLRSTLLKKIWFSVPSTILNSKLSENVPPIRIFWNSLPKDMTLFSDTELDGFVKLSDFKESLNEYLVQIRKSIWLSF
jgi:hypothetical protein